MNIKPLPDHQEVIPTLAQWFYAEWSYLSPHLSLTDVEDILRARTNTDQMPLTLIAFDGEELIGTVSLKIHDMDIRTDLSPWVSSLYVKNSRRGQGIGSQLVCAIEEKAKSLGVSRLFLYTPTAEDFYAKLNWQVAERMKYHGTLVAIMKKEILRTS